MATAKRWRNAIIFSIIILAPVAGAILLKSGKNTYKPLPYVGPGYPIDTVVKRGDTIIDSVHYQVPAWKLVDQDGKPSDTTFIKGKVYVMNCFFTTCPDICKDMTRSMRDVQKENAKNTGLRMLSYSVDPVNDTPERLKAYAKQYGIDTRQWALLTGNRDSIYSLLQHGYFMITEKGPGGKAFIHSPNLLLCDGKRHIRGIYDGTREADIKRLKEDILVLQKQEGMALNKQFP